MEQKAYATLEIKSAKDEADGVRISGMASTPAVDVVDDIVDPMGAQFKTPLPLFLYHDGTQTVGRVETAKATPKGVPFEAFLPYVKEPGRLKDRVDEAIHMLKYGLIRGVSIGFRARPEDTERHANGIRKILKWTWHELSLVPIPANAEATISAVKAACSLTPRGTGVPSTPKGNQMFKSLQEMESAKASKLADAKSLRDKADSLGRTFETQEQEQFDNLLDEAKQLDGHIRRMKEFDALSDNASTVVKTVSNNGAIAFGGTGITHQKSNEPVGVSFARYVRSLYEAKGSHFVAAQIAEQKYRDDPRVAMALKATVVAGSTVSGTWAADLVNTDGGVFAEFLEYLRPQTILGKFGENGVPALTRVPFYAPVGVQTAAGLGYWVGEGKGKPLTNFDYDKTRLEPFTAANIVVVTKKIMKYAGINSDTHLRDQLAKALAGLLDTDFIDPAKTADAGVSPASITQGLSAPNSAGNTADDVREDIKTLLAALTKPLTGLVFITDSTTAVALSLMYNSLGQREFPDVSITGGRLAGIPLIVSDYVPAVTAGSLLIAVKAPEILLADEGGFSVDMSEEASLEMSDAPTQSSVASVTATQLVSMYQTNSVAFRCERDINWARARSGSVALVDQVNYGEGA